ncbi:hypothetical protein J6590_011996 [Homalodisca vitripennis]|nr:hypothetical protein J6590_011996 [Homalodisca vitripennis]
MLPDTTCRGAGLRTARVLWQRYLSCCLSGGDVSSFCKRILAGRSLHCRAVRLGLAIVSRLTALECLVAIRPCMGTFCAYLCCINGAHHFVLVCVPVVGKKK